MQPTGSKDEGLELWKSEVGFQVWRVKGGAQRKFSPSGFLLRKDGVREVICRKGSLKLRIRLNTGYLILTDPGFTDNFLLLSSLTLLACSGHHWPDVSGILRISSLD